MTDWKEILDGRHSETPALVLGNGPSRMARRDEIRDFQGILFACNAYWRDADRVADYLVCYDKKQIEYAIQGVPGRWVIRPDPVTTQAGRIDQRFVSQAGKWLLDVTPFACNFAAPSAVAAGFSGRGLERQQDLQRLREDWHPRDVALGHLSGFLAFQAAILAGCDPIVLCGLDVAGVMRDNRIILTACNDQWDGYRSQNVLRTTQCREVAPDVLQPRGWAWVLELWHGLTDRANRLGQRVFRMSDEGAMTWLPVQSSRGASNPDSWLPSIQ